MIITCPNCIKKFQINTTLIPEVGRDLQCGSCKHVWFYKAENVNSSLLTLSEDIVNNAINDNLAKEEVDNITDNNKSIIQEKKNKEKVIKDTFDNIKTELKDENTGSKFFSYLIVLIISFVALIILIDTLKTPIINVFPGVEFILFSLFETLQDIKLFIIDLS